ncbi:MAG: plasmid pRiA4b ORF-3 family protein [Bacteroidales bacterium]|nr:plasmid pRiA4b ORF-3 family protein [Bacteroidales bacterium]
MATQGKGKKLQMNSEEGFIRLKARSLPINGCWISDEWEDTGTAYIVVSRRHPNGNITAGVFLVDLLCLGVKQAQILYDTTADEFEGILKMMQDDVELEKADCQLVHEIIYSGLEYAKKFGFEPHEEFELARCLLEEDNPKKRRYDIECGVDGKPMFVPTEHESDERAAEILVQLEKTAGPGNYFHPDNVPGLDELEKMVAAMMDADGGAKEDYEVDEEEIENSETFQFKVQLKNISKPPVWRRIAVPSYFTFGQLHSVICAVFGWSGAHLYSFSPSGYGSSPEITLSDEWDLFADMESGDSLDATETRLSEFFDKEGQHMIYIYDFGDDWTHVVTLEKIIPEVSRQAVCLAGKGACPPEDCGGPWAYQDLKKVLADKNHPNYQEMAEWIGLNEDEQWDANEFDLEDVQGVLEHYYYLSQQRPEE